MSFFKKYQLKFTDFMVSQSRSKKSHRRLGFNIITVYPCKEMHAPKTKTQVSRITLHLAYVKLSTLLMPALKYRFLVFNAALKPKTRWKTPHAGKKKYRKLVTITLGTMPKFGFIPYGTNTIETIINLDTQAVRISK
ncbi:hypothetical protein BpHYR1_015848 [Brachionus plicatilis]|uniref:Uncharacterized protein n=1 Tax=Brachionus plicatilis TaxID=10195 RepID=A0A3M7P4Q2_BRAPC|nr:hypothetical protein BpHYR1_015848 [Brachionus plicatilis]